MRSSRGLVAFLVGLGSVVLPWSASGQSRNAEHYVLLGQTSAKVSKGSFVSGNIGVNNAGGRLNLSKGSTMADGTQVVADQVDLRAGSRAFDVFSNVGQIAGEIDGTLTQPIALPVYSPEPLVMPAPFDSANFPPAFPVTCGGASKDGAQHETFALTPGTYDTVNVGRGGKVVLSSGTYNFCSLRAIKNGGIEVRAPATINIRDQIRVGLSSSLIPIGNPKNIQLNVQGGVVRLGPSSTFNARVFAPVATLRLGREALVTGHLVARRIAADKGIRIFTCGNGVLDPNEQCDTTAPNGDAACPGQCAIPGSPTECTCPTASTTTTTAAGTTTTHTTTTTTTTQPGIQCCVQSSAGGAFTTCHVLSAAQCTTQNGMNRGAGTCSPNPCLGSTTTTTTPSIQCCVQSSAGGAFTTCHVLSAAQCTAQNGMNRGAGTCSPNPCLGTTTTTHAGTTTTTAHAATTTTTTHVATTTTTAHATTTTTTTQPSIQCCVRSSPGGAFTTCLVLSAAQCTAQNGMSRGAGMCSPNPCLGGTTTTTTPPIQCCVQSSAGGAFTTCHVLSAAQCTAQNGMNRGAGTCSPNPCLGSTTTTTLAVPCPPQPTEIDSNFNGTPIRKNDFIWFNSVLKVSGLGSNPVTVSFDNAAIDFTAAGNPYHLVVPNAKITFSPSASLATTVFNTMTNTWETTLPSSGLAGNDWLTGLAFQAPVDLPGGINPVTWSGTFSSDTPGLTIHWIWAAAVYTSFSTNYNLLGVKPVDDNNASIYLNSDHAGTPENFKSFVIGGARGGGGSNFTGSLSATKSVTCP